jgi:hypothetical protein
MALLVGLTATNAGRATVIGALLVVAIADKCGAALDSGQTRALAETCWNEA